MILLKFIILSMGSGWLVAFLLKSMVEYFDLQYLCCFSICYSQSCVNVRSGMRQESVRLGRAGRKMSVVVSFPSLSEVFPRMRR